MGRPQNIRRDPRTDPQRGDEMRCGGLIRRALRRDGAMLWCRSGGMPYPIRLQVWRKWCSVPAPMPSGFEDLAHLRDNPIQ